MSISMKILTSTLLLSVAVLLSCPCYAMDEDSARQADHEMLRTLKAKVTTALNSRDFDALASCFAKEFVLTGVDQTVVRSMDELNEYYSRTFEQPDSLLTSIEVQPAASELTQFIDENTGVCYGASTDTYTLRTGGTAVMNSKWTATLVKEDNEWRIAAVHAGTDILDNPILNQSISMGRILAGSGFGVGVLLTLLSVFLIRRLRRQNT